MALIIAHVIIGGELVYGIEPIFWQKLFFLLVVIALILVSFNVIMRRLLKVKKRKFFSYDHVNAKHKKIDWIIRITCIIFLLIGFILNNLNEPHRIFFFEPWFIISIAIFISLAVQALMEWKYAEHRNDSIYTLSQLSLVTILLTSFYTTNLLNWLWSLFN